MTLSSLLIKVFIAHYIFSSIIVFSPQILLWKILNIKVERIIQWTCAKLLQSCPTLCNGMEHSLLGSPVHGILQARILEWVAIPFSRKASQPRNRTQVSCIAGRLFTDWATREANNCLQLENKLGKYLNGVRGIFGS